MPTTQVPASATLLLIQTDPALIKSLANAGYGVVIAANVQAAMRQYARYSPAVILIGANVDRPVELCVRIKAADSKNQTAVIILQETWDENIVEAALNAGASDCLLTSTPQKLLLHRIGQIMKGQQQTTEHQRLRTDYDMLFENAAQAFLIFDQDLKIIAFNRAAAQDIQRMTNQPPKIGQSILNYVPPERREASRNLLLSTLQGQKVRTEYSEKSHAGERNWFDFWAEASPITDSQERHIYLGSLPITERKNYEATLQSYADELERHNRDLDAYSHIIAHDLRSPLNLLLNLASMIDEQDGRNLSQAGHKNLDRIRLQTIRMSRMVEQLLWLSKAPDQKLEASSIPMSGVVRVATGRYRDLIDQYHIQIEVDKPLPIASAQPQFVEEVVANLVGNAIKYRDRAKASAKIIIRGRPLDGMARYEIQDNGIGIAPENQQQLFQMFSRIDHSVANGFGLGLSIAHRLVKRMGGEIGVESQLGQGSTFWFTLPMPKS